MGDAPAARAGAAAETWEDDACERRFYATRAAHVTPRRRQGADRDAPTQAGSGFPRPRAQPLRLTVCAARARRRRGGGARTAPLRRLERSEPAVRLRRLCVVRRAP